MLMGSSPKRIWEHGMLSVVSAFSGIVCPYGSSFFWNFTAFAVIETLTDGDDGEINCNRWNAVRCMPNCDPICAGNKTHKETFPNGCLYKVHYCSLGLGKYHYRIIDEDNACPINCDIRRKCSSQEDFTCVKNPDGTFNQTFTNECQFDNQYCMNYQKTLGLKYCTYRQKCW